MAIVNPTGISHGSTNSNGKLTLQGDVLASGENTFVLKSGTDNNNGSTLASSTIIPLVLSNIQIIADDTVIKGDRLPITAKMTASTTDLSGYSLTFSGAINGTYTTDKYGQATVYYSANGGGSKSVTVTAGNWSATKTFNDYIEYWDTKKNYVEHYGQKQGFSKLAQYYSLDTSVNNMGYVCIAENSSPVNNWELSFKVINPVTVYFDIGGWNGTGDTASKTFTNVARQVTFSANDTIKAICNNGTITVTKNNNSLYTDSFPPSCLPLIFIRTDATLVTSVNVGGSQTSQVTQASTLAFNELKFKEI